MGLADGALAAGMAVIPKDYSSYEFAAFNQMAKERQAKKKEDDDYLNMIKPYINPSKEVIHPKLLDEVQQKSQQVMLDIMRIKEQNPNTWKGQAQVELNNWLSEYKTKYVKSSAELFKIRELQRQGYPVPQSLAEWEANGLSSDLDYSDPMWTEMGFTWNPKERTFAAAGDLKNPNLSNLFAKNYLNDEAVFKINMQDKTVTAPRVSAPTIVGDKRYQTLFWEMPEPNVQLGVQKALTDPDVIATAKLNFLTMKDQEYRNGGPKYDVTNREVFARDLQAYIEDTYRKTASQLAPVEAQTDNLNRAGKQPEGKPDFRAMFGGGGGVTYRKVNYNYSNYTGMDVSPTDYRAATTYMETFNQKKDPSTKRMTFDQALQEYYKGSGKGVPPKVPYGRLSFARDVASDNSPVDVKGFDGEVVRGRPNGVRTYNNGEMALEMTVQDNEKEPPRLVVVPYESENIDAINVHYPGISEILSGDVTAKEASASSQGTSSNSSKKGTQPKTVRKTWIREQMKSPDYSDWTEEEFVKHYQDQGYIIIE